jgi:hypothetical protein
MKTSAISGLAIAAAAASIFATAGISTAFAADKAEVKCENSSACKGHGACKTSHNACKGQNACKGAGMTMQKSEEDCKAAQAANKAAEKAS